MSKPIKCPNCGKRMELRFVWNHVENYKEYAMFCPACHVCGPSATTPTDRGSRYKAARLTREWIARMEAEKNYVISLEISAARYQCAQELLKLIRSTPAGPLAALIEKWEGGK